MKTLSSWYTHFKCTFPFGGICDALIHFYIIWISLAFNAQCTVVPSWNNHWFSVEHLDAMWTNDMYHIADKWNEMKWRLNILFSIPNSYNSFLLWFYRVFLHVAFLGSGVHLWVVILLFLFVRFQEMLKIYHIFFTNKP